MRSRIRTESALIAVLAVCGIVCASETELRDSLQPQKIRAVSIQLNPSGAALGFVAEFAGSDPQLAALLEVIRTADDGGGHKCPNRGAIRFWMADGSVIGIGLLPSHTPGLYEFRLYDGDRLVDAFRVDRAAFLASLERLGVPTDDPAFPE
jgi:hypothetical protein